MKMLAVDDMPTPREALVLAIGKAAPDAEIVVCANAAEVLSLPDLATFDVAFVDIDMPGMSGIDLAKELKAIHAQLNIVFVTGYGEYMAEAFRLHSSGYIMKPVTAEKVADELDNLRFQPPGEPFEKKGLSVHCFGDFEVFVDGAPLEFPRAKSKELFAFLVDRRGAVVSMNDIEASLWMSNDGKSRRSYIRSLLHDIRTTFDAAGFDRVIVRMRNGVGVRTDAFWCDYYEYLQGNPTVINMLRGEYMRQYSWAETTLASLH